MKLHLGILSAILYAGLAVAADAAEPQPLTLAWDKNFLTIRGNFPGGEIQIMYLEAYCRPGSTDRDWGQTVIKHEAKLVSISDSGRIIRLKDKLAD
ncbi:MAG TPA: hypothetical protein VFB96_12745, partial [Pirellulaceae bacterium]|nr:hypothetical protein [Pirellulaceae bacterium]